VRQWTEVQKVLWVRQHDPALNFTMVTPQHIDISV
jgi:hypothetical protein